MKRLILLVILVMLAFWILKADQRARWGPSGPLRRAPWAPSGPPVHRNGPHFAQRDGKSKTSSPARRAIDEARQAVREARDELRQAVNQARDEFRHAIDEVRDEVRQAVDDPQVVTVSDDGPVPALPPGYQAPAAKREPAEGLPVPIIPGTRVTQAQAQPPAPPGTRAAIRTNAQADPKRPAMTLANEHLIGTVDGLISLTKERAEAEARQKLREAITAWLDPEVPSSWTPPADLVNSLVLETRFEPVVKEYGNFYVAHLRYDTSPGRRAQFLEVYHRELVGRRLFKLGGSLGFILICLAAISGYIRADEATKGYYTNRLRMLAAAGVGAAGVIIYQMFA